MEKKTVVIGASPKPERYAFKAIEMLCAKGYEAIALGIRKGKIGDVEIEDLRQKPSIENVHTVTMYLGAQNQGDWEQYILEELKPKRIIFNPGTENESFEKTAESRNIEVARACTLVLLSIGDF